MAKFEIVPSKTALVLIDVLNGFFESGRPLQVVDPDGVVLRLNKLIGVCRDKNILVVHIRTFERAEWRSIGLQSEFWAEFAPQGSTRPPFVEGSSEADFYGKIDVGPDDIVVVKHGHSSFYGTDLDMVLRVHGVDTVIMGGCVLHSCCESAARDARNRNYKVIFLSDGNAYYPELKDQGWGVVSAEELKKVVFTVLAARVADVSSVEEVMGRIIETPM